MVFGRRFDLSPNNEIIWSRAIIYPHEYLKVYHRPDRAKLKLKG
jgi:hypothetical protein